MKLPVSITQISESVGALCETFTWNDIQAFVAKAIKPKDDSSYCWIVDMLEDSSVVYYDGGQMYKRSYSLADDGSVTFGDAIKVHRVTTYEADPEIKESEIEERDFPAAARKKSASKGHALPDGSFPIENAEDLDNAIKLASKAKDPAKAMRHIRRRARALNLSSKIPKSWSESAVEIVTDTVELQEAAINDSGEMEIKVITPGWGSSGYYPTEVLERDGPFAFPSGTHMYWNHPTKTEAKERPERDLTYLAAVTTTDAEFDEDGPEGPGLYAMAKVMEHYREPLASLAPHIGVSIRAEGSVTDGTVEGRTGKVVESLDYGKSIDFVTKPGAGGKVVELFEAAGREPEQENTEMDEATKARLDALEAENAALKLESIKTKAHGIMTEAVKDYPDPVKARIIERIKVVDHTKDGTLNEASLREAVTKAAEDEDAYIKSVIGITEAAAPAKKPIDFNSYRGDTTKASFEESLVEAFKDLGLDEKKAKIAAAGR